MRRADALRERQEHRRKVDTCLEVGNQTVASKRVENTEKAVVSPCVWNCS